MAPLECKTIAVFTQSEEYKQFYYTALENVLYLIYCKQKDKHKGAGAELGSVPFEFNM